jgi:hypothetical protein
MSQKILATLGIIVALTALAYADPQKFSTEDSATKFCKAGNVVWFNPDSKIYFASGSQFYGKTKSGGYTCQALAVKEGYQASKGN